MRSYIDSIFDYLAGDTMWNEEASGEVDSPTGHFALVLIPRSKPMRDEMIRELENLTGCYAEDYADEDTYIRPGWYIIKSDSLGFVWPERYTSEDDAREVYEALEEEYGEWLGDDEDQYPHDEHVGLDMPSYGE